MIKQLNKKTTAAVSDGMGDGECGTKYPGWWLEELNPRPPRWDIDFGTIINQQIIIEQSLNGFGG